MPACIREIDDGEPAVAERDAGIAIVPGAVRVRSAMTQASCHLADHGKIGGLGSPRYLKYPGNSTHASMFRVCS